MFFLRLVAFLAGLLILLYFSKQLIDEIKAKVDEIIARKSRGKPVVEPEVKTLKEDKKILLKIKLPEIKSEKNIKIQKLGSSIELRAYSEDKTYFKLFPVPKSSKIAEKKLEGEELSVVVET